MAMLSLCQPAVSEEPDAKQLQELLRREALFHAQRGDYLAGISRLQLDQEQGLLPPSSEAAGLLLAQMKLAYGMHLEAGFDMHALLGESVPADVRNRAWFELAKTFSHRGYNEAAAEALTHVQGEVPGDITGDLQLLRATVLMALGRNLEAAQVLEQWQGAPELAAYAYYNRGIALARAGEYKQVVPILELATEMPAENEELLALRDKSRLSLGYAFARQEDYKNARMQLEAVRREGPFSNRALLALGWIAYKQGNREPALAAWMELQGRSPADPAVLETLLIVPAVQREQDAMQLATRNYLSAIDAYTGELSQLQAAREFVQKGQALSVFLDSEGTPTQNAMDQKHPPIARFMGPLLASRDFQQTLQGHRELRAMQETIDRSLQEINSLGKSSLTPEPRENSTPAPATPPNSATGPTPSQSPPPEETGLAEAQSQQQWSWRQGKPGVYPAPQIPKLPEIDSPARRVLKPFPERHASSPPPVSTYLREPPGSEVFGLPDSTIIKLPSSGEFFGRPASGEFFRRPGQDPVADYAYMDRGRMARITPGERYAVRVNRLLAAEPEEAGFDPGALPVGAALRELAEAFGNTARGLAEIDPSDYGDLIDAGVEQRIAALRSRILGLRTRITHAITLYENYTRAMTLSELDRRQQLLEDLHQQASLELAKTYDQSSDH
jgi:tetratricopeptide (TPR) repeat protein